jgi:hypothetical protein
MKRQRHLVRIIVLAAVCSVASSSAGDEWDEFHIRIDPTSPTSQETFDLHAFVWFGDSGYLPLEQSIDVIGNQINVRALIQDQHTRPNSVFLTVMTRGGAFFNDFGPLPAGTYDVNAEVWLTPWPATSGGYLYDQGSLQFTVTNAAASQSLPGDYTADGIVDAADYTVWRKTLNQTGPGLAADGNGNNQVDSADYTVWRSHFGTTAASATLPSTGATPEPATLMLSVAGAALLCGAASRRR